MAKIRRVIHSVSKPEPKGFDAQYWPILIAIGVLFGFLMGTVLTLVSGIWLWFSLIAIPVLVFSTTIALRFVDDRRFKRSTQLALITSLIVHLAMLLSAHHFYLFGEADETADNETEQKQVEKRETTIPIVFETQQWQQSQSKMTPQPNEEQVKQPRTEQEREIERKENPTPVDQTQREVTQNQNTRRQTQQTTPKRSETLSKLSRSNLNSQLKSGTKVSESTNNSSQANPNPKQNQPSEMTAKNSPSPNKSPAENRQPTPTKVNVDSQKSSNASQASVNRREVNQEQPQPQEQANRSTSRRSRTNPTPNPAPTQVAKSSRSRSNAPRPSPKASAKPTLEPTQTQVAQASRNRQADQPTQQAPKQTIAPRQTVKDPLATRRPNNQANPRMAQAPSSRSRTSNPTEVPNTTTMESPQRVVQAPRTSSQLNPRATNTTISRHQNVSPSPTQVQIQAPTQQTSALTQSATKASRRPNETLPSVTPNANPDPTPRRTSNEAAQVASNTAVESPSNSTSQSQVARSEGQPRNTTLNRSTTGTAGVGQSANVLSDAPTSPKPSMVASDSAVRRSTTQNTPQDTAFRPVQSALVRRSFADKSSPSAVMRVENSPNAKFAGSTNPAQLNAQSSASQINASSNARSGRVNAAQGSSTIDTGATKLVSEAGQGRASGGGQPDVDREIRNSSSQRSRNGEVTNSSLAANLRAETSQAPSELGGGRPSETTPDPNSTSLAKTVAGEGNQAVAGPTSASTSGPTEEASSAPSKSSATLARAAPNETAEGDLRSGGGDPNQNSDLRRVRSQLAGANANTKVAFSGENYTDREEGSNASDATASARNVGASDTSIDGQASSERNGVGESEASDLLAGGTEKSDGSVSGGSVARQSSRNESGLPDGAGSSGRQMASSRRRGGAAGPQTNSTVELPSGGGGTGDPDSGSSDARLAGMTGSGDTGIKRRQQTGGQRVNLNVDEGPGGLGNKVASDTGINSRRARTDSTSIQLKVDTRFTRKDAGGDPKINTTAVFSKGAFKGRDKGKTGASGPSTEPSIEMGLSWLAKQQRAPGNWSLTSNGISQEEADKVVYDTPTAATGLALLAFQGAGYNHKEYKYADTVNKGVRWLISNQDDDGCLYVATNEATNDVCRLYSHGIAAIALCEAYGMTNDPEVRSAAQKALDYIAASQDKTHGGWRYIPGVESDTSVTGWMVMALKSGKLAGLDVNQATLDLVDSRWLGFAADSRNDHKFRYNPNAKNTEQYPDREVQGKTPTSCMTSVGLLLRLYSGWDRTDERMVAGAKELLKTMPADDSIEARNTYYWYYATQVLKHVGGEYWDTWYKESLYPLLIRTQKKTGPMQGSWDPLNPVPDRWGYFSGRLYVTTMNLLTLEVKWRLLPLYDETVK